MTVTYCTSCSYAKFVAAVRITLPSNCFPSESGHSPPIVRPSAGRQSQASARARFARLLHPLGDPMPGHPDNPALIAYQRRSRPPLAAALAGLEKSQPAPCVLPPIPSGSNRSPGTGARTNSGPATWSKSTTWPRSLSSRPSAEPRCRNPPRGLRSARERRAGSRLGRMVESNGRGVEPGNRRSTANEPSLETSTRAPITTGSISSFRIKDGQASPSPRRHARLGPARHASTPGGGFRSARNRGRRPQESMLEHHGFVAQS